MAPVLTGWALRVISALRVLNDRKSSGSLDVGSGPQEPRAKLRGVLRRFVHVGRSDVRQPVRWRTHSPGILRQDHESGYWPSAGREQGYAASFGQGAVCQPTTVS